MILKFVCLHLIAISSLVSMIARCQAQSFNVLRVGFGKVDITPTRPTPMAGYYNKRLSTETHDPLWSKATVLDDGSVKVVIVALDLVSTTRWFVEEARNRIGTSLGIPAHRILIAASHSHTGPVLFDPASSRYNRFGNNEDETKQYMLELPEKIAKSVELAHSNLADARLMTAIGEEPKLAFNRRFFMSDGSIGWNPGKLNAKIVREAGPTDDTLPILAFFRNKQLAGVLTNFSIHLDTVGGTQWSADMPYALEECLARALGSDVHVQYSTGTCGDVNHINVRNSLPQKGHEEAAKIGTRLAGALLRSWPDLAHVDANRLGASLEQVQLPLAKNDPQRVAWAKSIADKSTEPKQPPFIEMVEAFRILDIEGRNGKPIEAEVQVFTLGDKVAWVGLPGEIFVQLGMAIKQASPFEVTVIHELANGSVGYVPTAQAYSQGAYEVVSARCSSGSGEQLVDSAIQQLRTLFAEQVARASRP